jgi:hypothetical protein
MIDTAGRHRIAELVRAQMAWTGMSGPGIEATGRVSRATVDRVKRADANVSDTMLRALGDVLGLPRDFLIYVGSANVLAIEQSGADADLLRWVLNLFAGPTNGNNGDAPNEEQRLQG